MEHSSVATAAILSCALALGCGSGAGDGNPTGCGLGPCGGAVVGSWAFTDACIAHDVLDAGLAAQTAELMAGCPGARLGEVTVEPSGTLVFNGDGSYSGGLAIGISFELFVPTSCIAPDACADLQRALQSNLDSDPDSPFRTVSCAQGSDCACTFSSGSAAANETGTYTTSATTLTLTSAGASEVSEYCVQGTTLTLQVPVVDPMESFIQALVARKR